MKPTPYTNHTVLALDETDSTNRYLKDYLAQHPDAPEGITVVAKFQTAGRGQKGNTWESETDKNLLFSTALFPSFLKAKHQFLISEITTLAIRETLSDLAGHITIKWPNDIYWNDRKICGMLIENNLNGMYMEQCVIGVGININQAEFRSTAPNPISLKQITGKEHDCAEILERILDKLAFYYEMLQTNDEEEIYRRYTEVLYRKDGLHPFKDKDGEFEAAIERIEPDGFLVLRRKNGDTQRYAFKEVAFVL